MIEYLECDDLVEQDRDHINRILFSPNHEDSIESECKSVQFPFDTTQLSNFTATKGVHDQACSPTATEELSPIIVSHPIIHSHKVQQQMQQHNTQIMLQQQNEQRFLQQQQTKQNHNFIQAMAHQRQPIAATHIFNGNPQAAMFPMHVMQHIRMPHFQQPPPNPFVIGGSEMYCTPLASHLSHASTVRMNNPHYHNIHHNFQGCAIMMQNHNAQHYNHMANVRPNAGVNLRRSTNVRNSQSRRVNANSGRVSRQSCSSRASIASEEGASPPQTNEGPTPPINNHNATMFNTQNTTYIHTAGNEIAQVESPVEKEEIESEQLNFMPQNVDESAADSQIKSADNPHSENTAIESGDNSAEILLPAEKIIATEISAIKESQDLMEENEQISTKNEDIATKMDDISTKINDELTKNAENLESEGNENEVKTNEDTKIEEPAAEIVVHYEIEKKEKSLEPGAKSWASLFRNDRAIVVTTGGYSASNCANAHKSGNIPTNITSIADKMKNVVQSCDDRMVDIVKECLKRPLIHRGCGFQLLGLYNYGNWCYVNASIQGRQEDAQEFLTYLMCGLHDEMIDVLSCGTKPTLEQIEEMKAELNENDEWKQVGHNKKANVTRQTRVVQSPISELFVLNKRYILKRGVEPTTVNIQPFYMFPLEISDISITDIESAMAFTMRAEEIDLRTDKSKSALFATRKPLIDNLPPVLILHLKYFQYSHQGLKKVDRNIKYSVDLKIRNEYLSDPKTFHPGMRKYKLFAVVFHIGEAAAGGHYVTDIFHGSGWTEMDDSNVFSVPEDRVLHADFPRTPYILFYRRCDLMTQVAFNRRN